MTRVVPRTRLLILSLAWALTIGIFLYLNQSFGGPSPFSQSSYILRATFPDSQNLVTQSLVMNRGIQIGSVTAVNIVHGQAQVQFSVDPQYRPVPKGTTAQIGFRTVFGEAIVVLNPGPPDAPALRSGATLRAVPIVEPDDALAIFDHHDRTLLQAELREIAQGLGSPDAGDELNETIGGVDQDIGQVRLLTDALNGQESNISGLVRSAATVLRVVATRDADVRQVVGSGRTVADAIVSQDGDLATSIDQLNGLLGDAAHALPRAVGLFSQARPLLQNATTAAATLSPALVKIAPLTHDARQLIASLHPALVLAVPALRTALGAARPLLAALPALKPAVANTVPIVRFIDAHLRDWEALIGLGADATSGGALHGFATVPLSPRTYLPCSSPLGLCVNPYPKPGDASNPQPYRIGGYSRLTPYFPR